MKKVSICIPAYNNAPSVRRLLESIEKQSFRDYEVIITDDSADEPETGADIAMTGSASEADTVRRLAGEKGYIRYYRNEKHLGAAANWNEAVEKSSGEYVKIMHHDDWFTDENSLGELVRLLEEHPEADLAFSGTRQTEAENSFDRFLSEKDAALLTSDYRNLFLGNTIGAPSAVIVRKSALGKAAYDEKLTWLVDMDYYMQILAGNPRFVYTEKPLVSIGIGGEQLTERCRDDRELNAFEYGYIFRKYGLEQKPECRKKLMEIYVDAGKDSETAQAFGIGKKEYACVRRRKFMSRVEGKLRSLLHSKKVLFLLLVLFAASLIPILMLSPVNHATGDDFGYGKLTHQVWTATHSPAKVAQAACETVRQYYSGWQGTWLSIFLFSLQPEVFSPGAYKIVPALMLAIWLASTGLLLHYLLVKKAGYGRGFFGILFLLLATAAVQFVPSTKSSIFWYNGTAHYTVPYAIALLAVYFYMKFMDGNGRKGKGAYAGLFVCMALLGGVNYQAALLVPLVIVLLAVCTGRSRKKKKRAALCLLPLAAEGVGLVISMLSPGNAVRGGEGFGFSIPLMGKTIFSCFVRGAAQAWEYMREHPLLLLFFGAAAVVCHESLRDREERKHYPHPVLFVILSYCVYCAVFAPELYAGVEVSGGVYNMNYYMFLFMVFGDIIYAEGALTERREIRKDSAARECGSRHWMLPVLAALGFLVLAAGRNDIKETTAGQCLAYMGSGQAADFRQQMELQTEALLDESRKDLVLPQINDDQGPLMHMPLTENPDAWTNGVVKEFYGKDSVIAIPREKWESLQEE